MDYSRIDHINSVQRSLKLTMSTGSNSTVQLSESDSSLRWLPRAGVGILAVAVLVVGSVTGGIAMESGSTPQLPNVPHPPLLSGERLQRIHASIDVDSSTYRQLQREVSELISRNNANAHEGVLLTAALQLAVEGGDVPKRVRNWFVTEYMREQSREQSGFGNPENRAGYSGRNSARSFLARMGYAFAWADAYAPDVFTAEQRAEIRGNLEHWIEHWLAHWEDPTRRAVFYPQDSDETLMLWESFLVYYYIFGPQHALAARIKSAADGLQTLVEKAYVTPDAGTFGGGAILVSPTYKCRRPRLHDASAAVDARTRRHTGYGSDMVAKSSTIRAASHAAGFQRPTGSITICRRPSFDHNNDGWLKTGNMASYQTLINYLFDTEGTAESRAVQWVLRRLPPLVQESNPEWRAGFIWGQLLMEDLVSYPPASPADLDIPLFHHAAGANVFAAKSNWDDDANSFVSRNTKRFEIDHFGQYGLHYEIWTENRPITKNGTGAVQGAKGHYANVQNTWYVENAEANSQHIGIQVPNMRVGNRNSETKTQERRGVGLGATANDTYAAVSWGARELYNMRGNRWNPDVDYLQLASRSIIHFWDGLTVVHDRIKQDTNAVSDIKKSPGYVRRAHRKQRFEALPESVDGWLRATEFGKTHYMRTETLVGSEPSLEIVDENGPFVRFIEPQPLLPEPAQISCQCEIRR